ncbi:MAG: hypothetical protein D6712_19755 [Chloroflexi bacterium]|nr:MAG: hypothetical protein D6712_19755 [Chloroflexota bacterium]
MKITVSWEDQEQRTLIYRFPSMWTWQEFYNAKAEAERLLDTVDHNVTVFLDFSQGATLPAGAVSEAPKIMKKRHPRATPVIFIGVNPRISIVINMVRTVLSSRMKDIHMVKTLDDAWELVHQLREADTE